MKINPAFFSQNFINRNYNTRYLAKAKNNLSLGYDTVCFSAKPKTDIKKQINELPPEAFPSDGLRTYMLNEINRPDGNSDIVTIHQDYYSKILTADTLDEAKKIYPELETVLDAKNIDTKKLRQTDIIRKISEGKIDGLNIETFSLELLKMYYAKLPSINDEVNFNNITTFTFDIFKNTLSRLNIKFSSDYLKLMRIQKRINKANDPQYKQQHKIKMQNYWSNETNKQNHSKKMKEIWSDSNKRLAQSDKIRQLWTDEKYRTHHTEVMKSIAQTPEFKQNMSDAMKKVYADSEHRTKVSNGLKNFYANNPEYKMRNSQRMQQRWNDEQLRKKQSEKMKQMWKNDDFRANHIDKLLEYWSNPENRTKHSNRIKQALLKPETIEKTKIVYEARKQAWAAHPTAKQIYTDIAKEFPRIGIILEKQRKNNQLTQEENEYLVLYFKTCHERYPDILKEVGAIQKEILKKSGYYDNND